MPYDLGLSVIPSASARVRPGLGAWAGRWEWGTLGKHRPWIWRVALLRSGLPIRTPAR